MNNIGYPVPNTPQGYKDRYIILCKYWLDSLKLAERDLEENKKRVRQCKKNWNWNRNRIHFSN